MDSKFSIVTILAVITGLVVIVNNFITRRKTILEQNSVSPPRNTNIVKQEKWSYWLTNVIAILGIWMAIQQCSDEKDKELTESTSKREKFVYDSTLAISRIKFDSVLHAQNDTILSKTNLNARLSMLHTIDQLRLEVKTDSILQDVDRNLSKTSDIFNFIYDGNNKPIIEFQNGRIDLMKEPYVNMPGGVNKFRSLYFIVSNKGKLDLENVKITFKGSLGLSITSDGKNSKRSEPLVKEYNIGKLKHGSIKTFHEGFYLIWINHFEHEFEVSWDKGSSYKLSIKHESEARNGGSRITELKYYDEASVFDTK